MSNLKDQLYLRDILDSIEAIKQFTEGYTYQEFQNDRKTFSATLREFQVIGEAIGKLSADTKKRYSTVLWQDIKDFRNKLIHEYFGIDAEIVWNTIEQDIPQLKVEIVKILEDYGYE